MIFIAGPHAAGKTLMANCLKERGYQYIDLGPTLREICCREFPGTALETFIQEGESKWGSDFTDSILAREVGERMESTNGRLVVVGSRSKQGIDYLLKRVSPPEKPVVVYVEADEQVLHERYCCREERELSWDEFQEKLGTDREMGLEGIRGVADYVVPNNGTVEEFQRRIDNLFNVIEIGG